MAAIYKVDELLARGLVPYWIRGMFRKELVSGSRRVGALWWRRDEPIYGLERINLGNESFDIGQWNRMEKPEKGIRSLSVYNRGGYGFKIDGYTVTQRPEDIILGEPVVVNSTNVASGTNNSRLETVIDNTDGSVPITQTVNQSASKTIQFSASTTNGLTETTTLTIGGKLTAGIKDKAGVEINASFAKAAAINTSSTQGTSNSETESYSFTNSYTVPPGYKIIIRTRYTQQDVTVPFTAPVRISGDRVVMRDKWGNTTGGNTAGRTLKISRDYTDYRSEPVFISPTGYWDDSSIPYGIVNTNGVITSQKVLNFETVQLTVRRPETLSELDGSGIDMATPLNDSEIVEIVQESGATSTGVAFEGNLTQSGLLFRGSNHDDYIKMEGANQIAYAHGGDDVIVGSIFGDTVYVGCPELGGNSNVSTGGGDDAIYVSGGSHVIDAGDGNDIVRITLKSAGANDVTLGRGNDIVEIDVTGAEDAGADFIIQDLSNDDIISFTNVGGSRLGAEIAGTSVNIYKDGNFIGLLKDYAQQFDAITQGEIIELGLINLGQIKGNYDSIDNLKNDLIKKKALGNEFVHSYSELIDDKKRLKRVLTSVEKRVFESTDSNFTRSALSSREGYDSLTSLVSATVANWQDDGYVFRISDIFSIDT